VSRYSRMAAPRWPRETRGQGGHTAGRRQSDSAEVCCGQGTKTSFPRTWPDRLMR
jgi:hypothetical protein